MKNIISIPVEQVALFGEVVREFTEQGLAFSVKTTNRDFVLTVTGY